MGTKPTQCYLQVLIKKQNIFSVPSKAGENRGKRLGEFESRAVKIRDEVESSHLLENFHKLCGGFHQAKKARRLACFIWFIEILFSVLTKRKTIFEIFMYILISFMKL